MPTTTKTTSPTQPSTRTSRPIIKLPWMESLARKLIEAIQTSTIGRVISGPASGLSYFARRVLPLLHPELSIVYHRLYRDNNMTKQHQGLLASVAAGARLRSDWWFHNNTMVGKRIVEELVNNKVDLLVIDGGENAQEDFLDVLNVIRQELRDMDAKCGILIMKRQPHYDTLALPAADSCKEYASGFVFAVGKLTKSETASLVAHWMPYDTTIEKRLTTGHQDSLAAIERIHGYAFAEFEHVEELIECAGVIAPGEALSRDLAERVIAWKSSN